MLGHTKGHKRNVLIKSRGSLGLTFVVCPGQRGDWKGPPQASGNSCQTVSGSRTEVLVWGAPASSLCCVGVELGGSGLLELWRETLFLCS